MADAERASVDRLCLNDQGLGNRSSQLFYNGTSFSHIRLHIKHVIVAGRSLQEEL